MKKFLLTLLAWSVSLAAQTGPQPLFISNITFNYPPPQLPGCTDTANISVTASGGQPATDGSYTYQLNGITEVGTTVQFSDVESGNFDLVITDSSTNQVIYPVLFEPFSAQSISVSVGSLPLGTSPGCITLTVIDPSASTTSVQFSVSDGSPVVQTLSKAPFTKTFSAFKSSIPLTALFFLNNDCNDNGLSTISITFPFFPQGMGNALKTYIFTKYCSCALISTTIPASQS